MRGAENARLQEVSALDSQLAELRRELARVQAEADSAGGGSGSGSIAIDMPARASDDVSVGGERRASTRMLTGVTNLTKLLTGERLSAQAKLYLVVMHVLIVVLALRCGPGAGGTAFMPRAVPDA